VEACLPHFTHFVCKADNNRRGRGYDEVPQLVRSHLLELGIDDANIAVVPDEVDAVNHALEAGEEGDLIVITGDDLARTWKQITTFNTDKPKTKETIPGTKVFVPGRAKRYELEEDEELIIDERGVRLARSVSEDGD